MNAPFLRTITALIGLFLLRPFASASAAPPTGGNPANDECAGAIELVVTPTCSPVAGDVAGATQSLPAITCSGNIGTADDDVWYWFTANNTSQMIEVVGSPDFNAVIDLRTGACNGTNYRCTDLAEEGGTEILTATNLTIGTVYYVRIYSRDATIPASTSFTICVHDPVVPVNNDCPGSITLVPNTVCSPISGTVAFATQSLPAIDCNGFTGNANDDVWFNFTATETTHTIQMVLGAGWDEVLDLRSGSCNGTSIACSDSPIMVASGLTVGETYYLRVYHYFNGAPTNTSFTICLLGEAPSLCNADASTMSPNRPEVCLEDPGPTLMDAAFDVPPTIPGGFVAIHFLSQGAGLTVVDSSSAPSFFVAGAGDYAIHTLVYDPTTFDIASVVYSTTTIADIAAQLIQGGGSICASLDEVGAPVVVVDCVECFATGGTSTPSETPVCLVAGLADISAVPDGSAVVPTGFEVVYLMSQGGDGIIYDMGPDPSFTVTVADDYTIYTFVYDPTTFDIGTILMGVTTVDDVNGQLQQGGSILCGGLDVTGALISVEECIVCDALAGALVADATPVCLVAGSADISATPDGNAVVPPGFEVMYLLSHGATMLIMDAQSAPAFNVTVADLYTIHTLVYDPLTLNVVIDNTTTIADVEASLIQGGGSTCASLDVTGAPITVEECIACDANAGTIVADATPVCLVSGSADISATPDGNAVVPVGYEIVYVLTQGAGLVIMDAGATPSFTVTIADDYTIHTLVYDPNTLDLGTIVPGVTTGFDVNALLIQGGGTICGSLDVAGAPITVQECITCDANAGALVANETPVCLVGGSANIVATPDGNAVVPVGYETLFVLTQGPGLVIVASSLAPDFSVLAADAYTIHTLVYDPNTLDLGFIVPGTTTASEVDALLIQGGGSICGSLDVTGALFEVIECVVCDADAGTLTADETPICLFGGFAQIGATPNGDAVEPDGYMTDYLLAQGPGLVIVGLNGGPVFSVNDPDSYTIHTIIYDPLTVDVGLIELGVTTIFDINALLIQGGGTICGSVDMLGAAISVNDCAPGNDNCVNAVPLAVNLASACPGAGTPGDNTYATTDGSVPSCADPGATPLDVWYTFNSGANTTVTITLDQGTMEDWAVVVRDGCNGNELACIVQPVAPIDLVTVPNTDYVIEVYSDLQMGNGGEFSICVSGDVPTLVCDGGSVQTTTGAFVVDVCQDMVADIIDFATTTASAESYTFLLTDESNVVIAQLAGGSLDFNSAALGVYRVWGISHNGDLVGADPGSIATEITSTGSCVDLSDNFVQVNVEICFGLLDADASSWNLFPNPGNGDFTLVYAGNDALTTMEIVDMDGRVVYSQQQLMTRGVSTQIALHGQLAQGVYVVRLTNTAGSNTMRLVVR